MHISSTTNRLSRSEGNVPIAVFIFEDRRKFLRVSENYFDTLERVSRAFSVANDEVLSIHTASLDVCKGVAVEIDESAYPLIWTVLDEITVKVEGKKAREIAIPTPRATPLAEISRQSTPKATGSRPDHQMIDKEQEEEEEVAMGVNAKAEIEAEREVDDMQDYVDAEAAAYERELLLEAEAAAEAETIAEAEAAVAAADLAWDFTEEQLKKGKDGKRKSTNRSETAESTPTSKFKPTGSAFGSSKGTVGRSIKSENTIVEPPRDTTSRSLHRSSSSRKEPTASTAAAATDADPRFEIAILGPESYQIAQFKTRGKHPVRKVLAAACRLFEIDYDSAHLYLGVPSVKGTRGAVKCEIDATMTQCGVDSHSRLYVRVNTGNEELESESEEDG